jgi:hypothetical protein
MANLPLVAIGLPTLDLDYVVMCKGWFIVWGKTRSGRSEIIFDQIQNFPFNKNPMGTIRSMECKVRSWWRLGRDSSRTQLCLMLQTWPHPVACYRHSRWHPKSHRRREKIEGSLTWWLKQCIVLGDLRFWRRQVLKLYSPLGCSAM